MKPVRKFLNAVPSPIAPQPNPAGGAEAGEIVFRASDSTPDRFGDRVIVEGGKLERFHQNPILLFEHNHGAPVGTGRVWAEGSELFLAPAFTRSSAKGREVENLVDEGVIRTVSIGFLPLKAEPNEFGGLDYLEWELLEVSFVTVPANPNALRVKTMKRKNLNADELAKSIAAAIKKALEEAEEEPTDEEPESGGDEKPAEEEPENSGDGAGEEEPEKSGDDAGDEEPEKSGDKDEEKAADTCPECGQPKPAEESKSSGDEEPSEESDEEAQRKSFFAALLSA